MRAPQFQLVATRSMFAHRPTRWHHFSNLILTPEPSPTRDRRVVVGEGSGVSIRLLKWCQRVGRCANIDRVATSWNWGALIIKNLVTNASIFGVNRLSQGIDKR